VGPECFFNPAGTNFKVNQRIPEESLADAGEKLCVRKLEHLLITVNKKVRHGQ
jgi:hypothetical protein